MWVYGGQESLSQVSKAAMGADADKENAVAPNARPATGDNATRKRKTSTSSQQSQPTSKRPVLGTVAELDMVRVVCFERPPKLNRCQLYRRRGFADEGGFARRRGRSSKRPPGWTYRSSW